MFSAYCTCGGLNVCLVQEPAHENNVISPGVFPVLSAIFPPLGVPIYFFRFFGFRNGGMRVIKSLGFAVIVGASYVIPYSILKALHV